MVTNTGATEQGEYVIVNQHYQTVATLHATDGWVLTLHEIVIRGHDAWVTANKNLPMDLSRYGGAYNGALIDSAVQEYDLNTGKLVRSWDALDHIPLSDSQARRSPPTASRGTPTTSTRSTCPATGRSSCRCATRGPPTRSTSPPGRSSGRSAGRTRASSSAPAPDFQWQHDVVTYPGSPLITMFDDHCCQITGGGTYVSPTAASRGLVLKLDQKTHTATLAGEYSHGSNFDSDYMGSLEPLANGNEMVGWGSSPFITEYSASGDMLLDARLPGSDITYRATG